MLFKNRVCLNGDVDYGDVVTVTNAVASIAANNAFAVVASVSYSYQLKGFCCHCFCCKCFHLR